MDINVDLLFSAIGLIVSVGGFLLAYMRFIREQEKRITTLEAKYEDLNEIKTKLNTIIAREENKGERIKALEVKMELFWQAVATSVTEMLKHPTQKRKDLLLDKLADKTITVNELIELKALLRCDVRSRKATALAAALMLARIDTLLYDYKALDLKSLPK